MRNGDKGILTLLAGCLVLTCVGFILIILTVIKYKQINKKIEWPPLMFRLIGLLLVPYLTIFIVGGEFGEICDEYLYEYKNNLKFRRNKHLEEILK
jgi:hypothetical protein